MLFEDPPIFINPQQNFLTALAQASDPEAGLLKQQILQGSEKLST